MDLIYVFILIFSILILIMGLWKKSRIIFAVGVCLFFLSAVPAVYELDVSYTKLFSSIEDKLEQLENH